MDLLDEARRSSPYEACGLLVSDEANQTIVFWMRNVAEDPTTQFRFDPETQLGVARHILKNNMRLLAIWHTHPTGLMYPSEMDLAGAALQSPNVAHLIVGSSLIVRFWPDSRTEFVESC